MWAAARLGVQNLHAQATEKNLPVPSLQIGKVWTDKEIQAQFTENPLTDSKMSNELLADAEAFLATVLLPPQSKVIKPNNTDSKAALSKRISKPSLLERIQ